MRLSEYLREIGQPLYYYPRLARVVGGVKACILLCRLIQWHGHEVNPTRGIYKSFSELCDETGMSLDEAKAASKALATLKIVRKDYDRLNHRLYYLIDFDRLDELWRQVMSTPESVNPTFPKVENPLSAKA